MDPKLPSAPPAGGPDAPRDTFAVVDLNAPMPSGAPVSWGPFMTRPDESAGTSHEGASGGPDDAAAFSVLKDILVGEYMAKFDRQLDQLEVELASAIEGVRQECAGQAERVQGQVAQEVAELGRLLKDEREERVKVTARVDKVYRSVSDKLQATIERTALDAKAGADRLRLELREELREEMARERQALGERADAVERHLKSVAASIGEEKVDRASLRALFEQLSEHFKSEGPQGPSTR